MKKFIFLAILAIAANASAVAPTIDILPFTSAPTTVLGNATGITSDLWVIPAYKYSTLWILGELEKWGKVDSLNVNIGLFGHSSKLSDGSITTFDISGGDAVLNLTGAGTGVVAVPDSVRNGYANLRLVITPNTGSAADSLRVWFKVVGILK